MNIEQIMKQAQQFQGRMNEVQSRLAGQEFSAGAGGGMVTATVNGRAELLRIEIAEEAIDPAERGLLQDLVVAAVNEAVRRAQGELQQEMAKLTGGVRIPGLF